MRPVHGGALWSEQQGSGVAAAARPAFLVKDGADVVFDLVGPDELAFYNLEGSDYTLVDLTPVYIVADGADLTFDQVGPAIAILADGGAGDLELTTDLSRTPIADLFFDAAGDLWVVPRTTSRLHAISMAGGIQLY